MHHNVANETICTRRAILVQAVIFSLLVLVLTPACSAFLPKSQTALAYRTTDRAFAQNAFFIPPKRTSFLSLAMGVEQVFGSLGGTLAACSTPSTALSKLTQIGTNTPPVAYFSALFLAGFGVPFSEDLLCVFAGTLLPTLSGSARLRLILALYAGVVVSDLVTFSIGRLMRNGIFEPFRKKLNLNDTIVFSKDAAAKRTTKRRKREAVREKLEKAHDYVGFVARLSVGFRPPMMLLAGFYGKVSFGKFALGTSLGAVVSLTAQLLLGYSMTPGGIASLDFSLAIVPLSVVICILLLRQFVTRRETFAEDS